MVKYYYTEIVALMLIWASVSIRDQQSQVGKDASLDKFES